MAYRIRALTPEDELILWEMLFQALHGGSGQAAPSRDDIRRPELARYVEGWGRPGDLGVVATGENDELPIGAAWLRTPAEDPGNAPELAFAVMPEYRRRGIASALLTRLVTSYPEVTSVFLSVAVGNPAVRLYEKFGFRVVNRSGVGVLMQQDRG